MRPRDIVMLDPNVEMVVGNPDEILVRTGNNTVSVTGVPVAAMRAILAAMEGTHTLSEIIGRLAPQYHPDYVSSVIDSLGTIVMRGSTASVDSITLGSDTTQLPDARSTVLKRPVTVLGNGRLALGLFQRFRVRGFSSCRPVNTSSFASCFKKSFLVEQEERVLISPVGRPLKPAPSSLFNGYPLEHATLDQLSQLLEGQDLLICALEDLPYRAALDVNEIALKSGTPRSL